jgi:hypothetical protein
VPPQSLPSPAELPVAATRAAGPVELRRALTPAVPASPRSRCADACRCGPGLGAVRLPAAFPRPGQASATDVADVETAASAGAAAAALALASAALMRNCCRGLRRDRGGSRTLPVSIARTRTGKAV